MNITICSSCKFACETGIVSDEFDAHGPGGTIKGNLGDVEVSTCCGEPTEEVDSDLHEWWLALRILAIEQGCEWLAGDQETHRDYFEQDYSPEEAIAAEIDAAASSM